MILILPLTLQTCMTLGKSLNPDQTNAYVTQEWCEAD